MFGGVYSPNLPALESLLGSKVFVGEHGVRVVPRPGGVFGPNQQMLRQAIGQLTAPIQYNEPEQLAQGIGFAGPLQAGQQTMRGAGDIVQDLLRSGLRTDISPYVRQAQRRFREDYLPAVAERISPRMSSLENVAGREASRIATDLGVLDLQYNNPAAILGMIPGVMQSGMTRAAFPGAAVSDLLKAGSGLRGLDLQPAGRTFDIFSALAGIPVQGQFNVGGEETGAESFAKYGNTVANLIESIGEFAGSPAGGALGGSLGGIL
jgi:hypothetical protein